MKTKEAGEVFVCTILPPEELASLPSEQPLDIENAIVADYKQEALCQVFPARDLVLYDSRSKRC